MALTLKTARDRFVAGAAENFDGDDVAGFLIGCPVNVSVATGANEGQSFVTGYVHFRLFSLAQTDYSPPRIALPRWSENHATRGFHNQLCGSSYWASG